MQATRSMLGLAVFVAFAAAPLGAQDKGRDDRSDVIPKTAYPPAGLCRVWLTGVAPSQQPAATDCTSAIRNQPANSKVLFGDMPGLPAAVRTMPPSSYDMPRNSWNESRRQGGGRSRMAPPAAAPMAASPSPVTASPVPVQPSNVTVTPVQARTVTTVPASPPPPAKPAAKPEQRPY